MGELKPILIPEELRAALAAEAASEGLSLEEMSARAVQAHLDAIKSRKFFEERAGRRDGSRLLEILDRGGDEPPRPGDEIPESYRRKQMERAAKGKG
jgi:Ni/Co efflux regulator RcnB